MLQFDEKTARMLDEGYQGSDIVRRRLQNLTALAPEPGDTIADIGAGTGLLTLDLSRAVGETGSVVAIDPSAGMRAAATTRCADRTNVRIVDGTVETLPLADTSVDRAISVHVFEYIDDIPMAITEVRRILRPGGRLVISDLHWDSHIWHADDSERMNRMLRLWDRSLKERRVPALLPPLLNDAGFVVEAVKPVLCQDTVFRADGLARLMSQLICNYARQNGLADPDEVDGWISEQHQMAEEGRFFFAITHYIVSARRL